MRVMNVNFKESQQNNKVCDVCLTPLKETGQPIWEVYCPKCPVNLNLKTMPDVNLAKDIISLLTCVLEWYADHHNYDNDCPGTYIPARENHLADHGWDDADWEPDFGEKASTALYYLKGLYSRNLTKEQLKEMQDWKDSLNPKD